MRKIIAVILILFCLWLLLPLLKGIVHIGMIYPVLLLLPLICVLLKPDLISASKRKKALTLLFIFAYALIFLFFGGTLLALGAADKNTPPADSTAVVLGCKVHGTKPSRVLLDRCNVAADYLRENPDSVCIACGGRGKGEDISEAEAIFNVLTAKGISPERIYLEARSVNTEENLIFAAEIITAESLPRNVAIVSDRFHQLRAGIFAKRAGLTPYAVSASTYLFVLPGYWAREILALWAAILPF